MDVFDKYHFFFFQVFDTDVSVIFDENFSQYGALPSVPVPHYHEAWEIYCVTRGELLIQCEDQILQIPHNRFLLILPYTRHRLISGSEDLRHTSIRFFASQTNGSKNTVQQMLKTAGLTILPMDFATSELLEQLKILYGTYLNNTVQQNWTSLRITATVMQFFINILETASRESKIAPPVYKRKENHDLMLMEYLMLCGPVEITLSKLANALGYSEAQTTRIIKKKFGKSFRTIISEIKLEKARLHLVKTDDSIEHISALLGFKNSKAFFSSFKNAEGISPTEYRKLHKPK